MTREEAIAKVKGYLTDLLPSGEYDEVEEIIKVLEQEPREITLEDVKEYCKSRCLSIITNELLYELTHPKIKALEQEPFINKPCVSSGVCEHDKNTVLDKIRTEIEQLPTTECTETRRIWIRADDFKEEVLKVLHRCTESEDK